MSALLARLVAHRLFWPIVMLLVLFAINLVAFPGFFTVTVREGHLFGSLIDILRNGAPTLIIAVGMTLVIATRGIDLSVGAVAAISGAVACSIILGSPEPGSPATVAVAFSTTPRPSSARTAAAIFSTGHGSPGASYRPSDRATYTL